MVGQRVEQSVGQGSPRVRWRAWPLLVLLCVLGLATPFAGAGAAPRPLSVRRVGWLAWDASSGVTPSLPSEANPQGPSALVRWRSHDWLLDTAGQRLVRLDGQQRQPLPEGWWEDAVALDGALWLLQRTGPQRGVLRLPAGRSQVGTLLPQPRANEASALLTDSRGGPPWLELRHRELLDVNGLPERARPEGRPTLQLQRTNGTTQLVWWSNGGWLPKPIALPQPIRLIRDAGKWATKTWVVWDDAQGGRWLSRLDERQTAHRQVCKGLGPWQQLRVARGERNRVRVVCTSDRGVSVEEVRL